MNCGVLLTEQYSSWLSGFGSSVGFLDFFFFFFLAGASADDAVVFSAADGGSVLSAVGFTFAGAVSIDINGFTPAEFFLPSRDAI